MDELIAWLTKNTVQWSLEVQPHKGYYQSADEYLSHMEALEIFEDADPRDEMVSRDLIFEARAYPSTPIGFFEVRDVTPAAALQRLRQGIEG